MAYISPRYQPKDKRTQREIEDEDFRAKLLGLRPPPEDQSPYRRRANEILLGGQQATAYEVQRRNEREQARLEQLRQNMLNSGYRQIGLSVGQGQGPNFSGSYSGMKLPAGKFGAFLSAIAGRESGGNYRARNKSSGALGKYQIMPGNIRGWSKEALGYSISPQQFYQSPALQEAIAQYKLRQYYNQYGPWGAAVAWYAGPGALKYGYNALHRKQGAYSSIATYADAIMRRLGY